MRWIIFSVFIVLTVPAHMLAQAIPAIPELMTFKGQGRVDSIALSADGALLAIGHGTGDVIVWDLQNRKLTTVLREKATDAVQQILSLSFSSDAKTLHVTGGYSGRLGLTLMKWNIASERFVRRFFAVEGAWAISYEHNIGLTTSKATNSKVPFICDLDIGEGKALAEHSLRIEAFLLSENGERIVTVTSGAEKPIRVWNRSDRKLVSEISLKGEYTLGQTLSISNDGKRMATIGYPSHIHMQILELDEGKKFGDPFLGVVMPMTFMPDGRRVVASSTKRDAPGLHVWDIESRQIVMSLRGTATTGRLAVSADGRFVAIAESGGTISVWQIPKLEPKENGNNP